MRRSSIGLWCGAACIAIVTQHAIAVPHSFDRDAQQILDEARARAVDIPKQAEAITQLAWPIDGGDDPAVQHLARHEIVHFGQQGLRALRAHFKLAKPIHQADITAAIIEASRHSRGESTADYLPALEEAIWFGSIEAQRIAMLEIAKYPFPPAVLSIIDAIHASPALTTAGLQALGKMGDARARFFLRRVLLAGDPRDQFEAARSLSMLGDEGLPVLRHETTSDRASVREAAMSVFLNLATTDDLTMLYEYLGTYETDSETLLRRIAEKATKLEAELEAIQLSEAASADPPQEANSEEQQP